MGLFANAKKKVQKSVETKAKELYSKASPKVQKEIDKFLASKARNVLKYVPYAIGAGVLIYMMSQNDRKSSEEPMNVSFAYYNIQNTYNFYKGE